MSKATMKYEGTNPLEKLREGEPYFFLRAQDKLSVKMISAYADLLKAESDKAQVMGSFKLAGELYKQSLGVLKLAHIFIDWQIDNEQFVKLPD